MGIGNYQDRFGRLKNQYQLWKLISLPLMGIGNLMAVNGVTFTNENIDSLPLMGIGNLSACGRTSQSVRSSLPLMGIGNYPSDGHRGCRRCILLITPHGDRKLCG